jgi:hypothetical protein
MRIKIAILSITLFFISSISFSQTTFKEQKAGHIFYVSLPEYMNKTVGLNTSASLQFKNSIKDIAGFIIEDNKEELKLAEMNYSSISEFYEDFIKDFLIDEEKRNISKPIIKNIGGINFVECDATYYEKESKLDLYYFVGIAETSSSYYKVLCFGSLADKDKYKADFQKILYSLRD